VLINSSCFGYGELRLLLIGSFRFLIASGEEEDEAAGKEEPDEEGDEFIGGEFTEGTPESRGFRTGREKSSFLLAHRNGEGSMHFGALLSSLEEDSGVSGRDEGEEGGEQDEGDRGGRKLEELSTLSEDNRKFILCLLVQSTCISPSSKVCFPTR
jgi:hypothetical protein